MTEEEKQVFVTSTIGHQLSKIVSKSARVRVCITFRRINECIKKANAKKRERENVQSL